MILNRATQACEGGNHSRTVLWTCASGRQDLEGVISGIHTGEVLVETVNEMVGASPAICAVFDLVRKMATTEMPVLITGETGTGKELTAQAIHERSLRKHGPFVPINCGAIPETLLESELFGHERGAFTGAVQQKKGKLEAAAGGTLFLDEVGDLLPTLQVKLLRFLQEGTFERVGGQETLHVDARVSCRDQCRPENSNRQKPVSGGPLL